MAISRQLVEEKKNDLEEQFKNMSKQLTELDQTSVKLRADATAVNGAIQILDQILTEDAEMENKIKVSGIQHGKRK